jgi:hypothetical protein
MAGSLATNLGHIGRPIFTHVYTTNVDLEIETVNIYHDVLDIAVTCGFWAINMGSPFLHQKIITPSFWIKILG